MEIKVKIISQYGNQRIFPACAKAELFCKIAGATTLTDDRIQAIKALGYAVTVVHDVQTL